MEDQEQMKERLKELEDENKDAVLQDKPTEDITHQSDNLDPLSDKTQNQDPDILKDRLTQISTPSVDEKIKERKESKRKQIEERDRERMKGKERMTWVSVFFAYFSIIQIKLNISVLILFFFC